MKKIINYIMFVMFMVTSPLFANDIYVTQSGASLTLDVLLLAGKVVRIKTVHKIIKFNTCIYY